MVEPQVKEYVKTAEGEIIPRGPIGKRSVYTTPKGRIINMDMEGLPIQLGPKPEIIKVNAAQRTYQGGLGFASDILTQRVQEKEDMGFYGALQESMTFMEKFEMEQNAVLALDKPEQLAKPVKERVSFNDILSDIAAKEKNAKEQ